MLISPQPTDTNGQTISTGSQRTLGKDDFFKLFVTKLRNQNPLEPMDDEALVSQLAEFSSLEQMQNMNDALQASLRWNTLNNQTINNSIAPQLIGATVTAEMTDIVYTGANTPKVTVRADGPAAELMVRILDGNGQVVRTLKQKNTAAGNVTLSWDGKTDSGADAAPGAYAFEIEAVDGAGKPVTTSASFSGKVTGVVYRNGAAYLKIGDSEISLGDIREINRES